MRTRATFRVSGSSATPSPPHMAALHSKSSPSRSRRCSSPSSARRAAARTPRRSTSLPWTRSQRTFYTVGDKNSHRRGPEHGSGEEARTSVVVLVASAAAFFEVVSQLERPTLKQSCTYTISSVVAKSNTAMPLSVSVTRHLSV